MATPHREESLGRLLKRAEQSLLRAKSDTLKPLGLTLAQYAALVELDVQPGVTGAALARACLVSPQAMMVLLKAMQEQGLIDRKPHLRHPNVLELHLTDVGREALLAGRQAAEPVEERILQAFTAAELGTFRELLTRCIDVTGPCDRRAAE